MTLDVAFDRTFLNVRERPLSGDINQMLSNQDYTIREVLLRMFGYRDWTGVTDAANLSITGFVSDGFKVDPGSGMQVVLRSGIGGQYNAADEPTNIDSANNLNDTHPMKPLVLSSSQAITVPNADPTNPRIDIVEVKYNRQVLNPQSRDILNTTTGVFTPGLVNKDLVWDLLGLISTNGSASINYKTGTPAGSPVEPSPDSGYITIAAVYVPAAASSLAIHNIADRRRLLQANGTIEVAGSFVVDLATQVPSNLRVVAPPGVDVVVGASGGSNQVTDLAFQIIGPLATAFDEQNVGELQGGSAIMWVTPLNSGGNPITANPVAVFDLANNASFANPSPFFFAGLTSLTNQISSPSDWATSLGVGMAKVYTVLGTYILRQWDGTNYSNPPGTGIGSSAKLKVQFKFSFPG